MRIFIVQDLVWHEEAVLTFHPMSLKYGSGEEVQAGDRVLYASEASQIEFVATAEDQDTAWRVEQIGGGCMILSRVSVASSSAIPTRMKTWSLSPEVYLPSP